MIDIAKKLLILSIVVILSVLTAGFFIQNIYDKFFGPSGTYLDFSAVVGLPLAYIFFILFFFAAFGGQKKYWWIGILLIPAVIFELYFDFLHIYFPIILGLVGWAIGYGLSRFLPKGAGKQN